MTIESSHWSAGSAVKLRVRQEVDQLTVGVILATLVEMTGYGVTVTQQIDDGGKFGTVLWPWHRVLTMTMIASND